MLASTPSRQPVAVTTFRPFTSDDVAQQNIVESALTDRQLSVDTPKDNFVLKLPIYAAIRTLPVSPECRLLISAILLNVGTFLTFYLAIRVLARTRDSFGLPSLLPFVWLASLGGSLLVVLINPNTRNVEIGLAFLLLAFIASWYTGHLQLWGSRGMWGALVLAMSFGLLLFDDPFFAYTFAAPLALVFGGKWLLNGSDRRALYLLLGIMASLLLAQVWHWLFWLIGYRAAYDGVVFAPLSAIGHNAMLFSEAALNMFRANIFGRPVVSPDSLGRELNSLALGMTLLAPLLLTHRAVRRNPVYVFLVLQPVFLSLSFILGNVAVDALSSRYLVIMPFFAAIILAVVVPEVADGRVMPAILSVYVAAAVLNIVPSIQTYWARGDSPNISNTGLARLVSSRHLSKGYADYWNAGIDQYYTGGKTAFIQVGCSPVSGVRPYRLLLNMPVLERQASRSFYLLDAKATRCKEADLERYFGKPTETVRFNTASLLLYDYDITARMKH